MEVNEEIINKLYGKIYSYNDKLLALSEKELKEDETYKASDIFDFYITSHAQAYLKNLYFGQILTQGTLLNIRCIMEGLALKRICQKEEFSFLQEQLLQKQVFLIEYRNYSNPSLNDIRDNILSKEKLKKDSDDAKKLYRELLKDKYSNEKIKKIVKSQIPFLCDPELNYRKIISEELGEDYGNYYGFFSSLIHPSVNSFYKDERIETKIIEFLQLIDEEYRYLPESDYCLDYDCYLTQSDIGDYFINICEKQKDIIETIADELEKIFTANYVSDTFRVLAAYYLDFAIEKNLGLSEQIKCKWKCILELLAVFHYLYFGTVQDNKKRKLLNEHMIVQTKRNFKEEFSLDYAYSIYQSIFPKCCSRDKFGKSFLKVLGYTINENGEVKTITEIVKSFAKLFNVGEGKDKKHIGEVMILDYLESQMLSHANSYMWFANRGAFMDVNNIIQANDICLIYILEKIKTLFDIHRQIEEDNDYLSIINLLDSSVKQFKEISQEKIALLSAPSVLKWNISGNK